MAKIDGTYEGKIVGTSIEKDGYEKDGLVLCFEIELVDGETGTAKHRTHGQHARICQDVIKALGLEWPKGIGEIDRTVGQDIRVRLKSRTNDKGNTFQNWYVATSGGGEPADLADVNRTLRSLGGGIGDDDLPFGQ